MRRDDLAAQPPAAEQVELMLARIEQSQAFRGSPRHRELLRHLVSRSLVDDIGALKETVIAVEVFGRSASRFDPRLDSIVRVETRRLRARLARYFASEGQAAPLRIELPVGSYVPLVASYQSAPQGQAASRRARDLIERGEHYLRQALSRATLESAIDRFDAALRESPLAADACVGLGRAWLNLATGWYAEPAVASEHAAEALRRALVLQPDHATAHALLGAIQHQFEANWPAARRSFERAVKLAPERAFVHSAYGCHLFIHNALDDAERELILARRLDPQYVNTRIHMVNLRIVQGRLDDAAAETEALRDIAPGAIAVSGMSALIALLRGDTAGAVALFTRACEAQPDYPGCFISLAGAMALAGRVDESDALMAKTLARFDNKFLSPYVLAIYATRRGRHDEAFALLERAIVERDPNAMQIGHDPCFRPLHVDPRWPALAASLQRPRRP